MFHFLNDGADNVCLLRKARPRPVQEEILTQLAPSALAAKGQLFALEMAGMAGA